MRKVSWSPAKGTDATRDAEYTDPVERDVYAAELLDCGRRNPVEREPGVCPAFAIPPGLPRLPDAIRVPPAMMPGAPPMPYGYPPPGAIPYGMPVSQPMPYAAPVASPIPPDPRRPIQVFDEAGPKKGATEPYLVGPGGPDVKKKPTTPAPSKTPNSAPPGVQVVPEPSVALTDFGPVGAPAEPYVLYEGRRYLAETKQDNVTVFGTVSYIHWWTRHDQTPVLYTTGNSGDPNAGALGNPNSQLLLGGGPIAPHEFSGVQATFGIWLDPEKLTSLEFGGFFLGYNSRTYAFASDANGNNVIAQPVNDGAFLIAAPASYPASPPRIR